MATEDDSSSVSEDIDENLSLHELVEHVGNISTKIRRKKENLEEFVQSMNNENAINKTVFKRFQGIEEDFKEGRKTRSELRELQKKLNERIKEVNDKVERIQIALEYITTKEIQIRNLRIELAKQTEGDQEELIKIKHEIQSLFSEIKIKFRESKKVKLSLLTKFKPDDLIQSVKSWEKAAETAREINRKVSELQKEVDERTRSMHLVEKELQDERNKSIQHEDELLRLVDDMKTDEDSKKEQAGLINNFRSLLDESEKLARNLEAQNGNLNKIISDEKQRVSDLRIKLNELNEQIQDERKSNREMRLQHEHMRAGFLAATAENEGYARDMAAIRKELDAIKVLQGLKRQTRDNDEEDEENLRDQIEELETKLQISDKMVHAKYLENETLQTDLDKTSERVVELETKVTVMNENITKVNEKIQIREREVMELTELLKDTQTALESEKLAKDEYIIKCELLERKLALLDVEGSDERDGIDEEMEREILDLREKLDEERAKVADKIAQIEELEVQLVASEELREYEEDIKTRSIENIVQAEMENRKLKQIVEELRKKLSEKDSGLEELIAHCAVEELKLREEITGLTNQLQVYKRDCVYKANIIERLRRKMESQRSGLRTLNEEDDEESEADLLVRTAALERKLHEERLKIEKYEHALLALNKQCDENEDTIREKDYELSRKSAEDGKRIAELLQELESEKKSIMELDEQIENLEDILSLKEEIEKLEDGEDDTTRKQMENELSDMKEDYAFKKIRRRDDLIQEMRIFIEELRAQLREEQERLRKNEDLIADLNDSSVQDLNKIDKLTKTIAKLEEETTSQKEYIDKLTQKITEGQRLIAQLEGVADKERMRVSTIEQLLLQDKQQYSEHLSGVVDLKHKVEDYQANVNEIKDKIERINRNISYSPHEEMDLAKASQLEGKLIVQKTVIKELRANVSAVEERSEELDAELRDQKGKNIEQDEKIDKLVQKTLECEDLVEFMKSELELVRKRYRGLSGLPEEESPREEEAIRQESEAYLEASPLFNLDEEKDRDGDDELEEGESDGAVYSSEDQGDKDRVPDRETRQREIVRQLLVFENVFEKIFSEEGVRIDTVIKKFERVMEKNTELLKNLQNVRQTLNEARKESERKQEQIEQMEEEFLNLKEELDETKSANERIRHALAEEEERGNQLSEMLTDEQVKGIASEEKGMVMQRLLDEQQKKINSLETKLSEEMLRVNQLKESLSVEQLIKIEHEREIEILKSKVLEEQESSEILREELERETTTRYEFDGRMKEIEEEASNRANIIDELQKDLETERKCYGIVTERLEAEQDKLIELEQHVKHAEESSEQDKVLIEELRESITQQEKQKNEFLDKLEKFERESTAKDEEIGNLVDQLGTERNKMEDLIGEIDLEKMGKSTAEAKLRELEECLSKDEQIFEELRWNIDSESAKNRELSDLLDREQERNSELEEKARELEKQVLMDLELFEELKETIEQERAHNRELDALLSEKNSAFNNRDKLLTELDSELMELKTVLQKEKFRNNELNAELKKKSQDEEIVHDLKDMLKAEIVRSEELDSKAKELEKQNQEQKGQIDALEEALKRLKELSKEISKELTEDLQAWGAPIDDKIDFNGNFDCTEERDALRFKALLSNELTIKNNLMLSVEEYKAKLQEHDFLLSELKDILQTEERKMSEMERTAEMERKQKEEAKSLVATVENELKLKSHDAETLRENLDRINVLYKNVMEEKEQKNVEVLLERKQKEEAKSLVATVENELKLKSHDAETLRENLDRINVLYKNAMEEKEQKNVEVLLERKEKEEARSLVATIENELKLKSHDAETLRENLDRINVLYKNVMVEREQKNVEVETLSKAIEDKEIKQEQFIKELRENIDKMENHLREKEEEGDMLRSYFEEEHKFAQDRLEQNKQLKQQLQEMENKLENNEKDIRNLLNDKANLQFSLEKTGNKFQKQREILVDELKDKTKKHNEDVEYIKQLTKSIEDVSQKQRRNKSKIPKAKQDTKEHLKEIEDDFDALEVELANKDDEIAGLKKSLKESTSTKSAEIQKEFENLQSLAEGHKERARRAMNALEKARLLREVLQTELEIKNATIENLKKGIPAKPTGSSGLFQNYLSKKRDSFPNIEEPREVSDTTGNIKEEISAEQQEKGEQKKTKEQEKTTISSKEENKQGTTEEPAKEQTSNEFEKKETLLKDKEEEISRLRDELSLIQTAMDKEKSEKEIILEEKSKEIEEQAKTITLIRNMYQVLQYEAKREKIIHDVLPSENTNLQDAKHLYKDLEDKLLSLKVEISEKTETISNLKNYIDEIKAKQSDKAAFERKVNIQRVLSLQLKEKERKLVRLENLLKSFEKLYGKKLTEQDIQEKIQTPRGMDEGNDGRQKDPVEERIEVNLVEKTERSWSCYEPIEGSDLIDSLVNNTDPQTRNDDPLVNNNDPQMNNERLTSVDGTGNPVVIIEKSSDDLKNFTSTSVQKSGETYQGTNSQDLPKSGWKIKLLVYMIIAIGLGFLPQIVKEKTLRIVLPFAVTPLFFAISSIEVKVYRKKIEEFVQRHLGSSANQKSEKDSNALADQAVILKTDETLLQNVREDFKSLWITKNNVGSDEDDKFTKQKKKVDSLEKTIRNIEKSKIDEKEKNNRSFDEYIKLRKDVDDLKKRRDLEAKPDYFDFKKLYKSTLDGDLSLLSVRPRSLPLWVAVSAGLYYLTTLHPSAPCAMFLLVFLFAVNSWYKIKNIKLKLMSEREVIRDQNDELEDLTMLLEQEHNVVKAQKAAMEIMQREIDNEYVSRKSKSLTLARMIMEVRELDEMRQAMQEENLAENQDPELKKAVLNVSKQNVDEKMQFFVDLSRKIPEPGTLADSEDINETMEDLATTVHSRESGTQQEKPSPINKKTNPKPKLVAMAALGSVAFAASLFLKYYIPALLIAIQLVLIIQLFFKHKLLKISEQIPSSEMESQLKKEQEKNKANRQQIGKLRRLLETEKTLTKSDECAKEIQKRVSDRAAKRKNL